MTEWKLWTVDIVGYGQATYTAPSRGRAMSQAYGDLTTACGGTIKYGDFLKIASCKRRADVIAKEADGYDYVRRNYGINVAIGERVTFANEPSLTGKEGVVLYPGQCTAHVRCAVEGYDRWVSVHPMNVRHHTEGTAR